MAPSTMDTPARIIIVDDQPKLVDALTCCGYKVDISSSADHVLNSLKSHPADLVIADLRSALDDGELFYEAALQAHPDLPVVLISPPAENMRAVNALKRGVFDFLVEPFELMEAVVRVRMALDRGRLIAETRALRERFELSEDRRTESKVIYAAQDSLSAFIGALESKDEFTHNHSARVSELASRIGSRFQRDKSFLTSLRFGSFLHDIGKIGVRESILNKPGPLTEKEYADVMRHPVIGEAMLRPLVANPEVLAIVRNHHERWDGYGYPDRLAAAAIPLGARIVAVADSFDAMTSARPYRLGMTHERAVGILREGAGSQWDKAVVDAFLGLVSDKQLPERYRAAGTRRERALPASNTLSAENVLRNAA